MVNAVDVVARVAAATTMTRKEVIVLFIMVKGNYYWQQYWTLLEVRTRSRLLLWRLCKCRLMLMLQLVVCSVLVSVVPAKICHPPLERSRVKLSPAKSAFCAPKIERVRWRAVGGAPSSKPVKAKEQEQDKREQASISFNSASAFSRDDLEAGLRHHRLIVVDSVNYVARFIWVRLGPQPAPSIGSKATRNRNSRRRRQRQQRT